MSEEARPEQEEQEGEELPTQAEQEETAKVVRWPELGEEPEVDEAVVAEVEELVRGQMAEEEDGSP